MYIFSSVLQAMPIDGNSSYRLYHVLKETEAICYLSLNTNIKQVNVT